MNANTPPTIQLNTPVRPQASRHAPAPGDADDAPSFGDAMKHASSPRRDDAPTRAGEPRAQAPVPTKPAVAHHAAGKGHAETTADDTASLTDAGDAADASATAATPVPVQAAGTPALADGTAATADVADDAGKPAASPADAGSTVAAAMLALIQQSAVPRPVGEGSAPATSASKEKPVLADDIGAAITASSKMAQALTGSLGGAVAGTVADAATGVVGKAVGMLGNVLSGLGNQADKADAAKLAPQLPDPAQLATGQIPQAAAPVAAPVALQSAQVAGTPAFASELGQQIAWMSNGDIKEASIRLHPEDMGQLDVKISVQHNRVDVAFAAQHPAAVQAVNQTLAQLDTMLAHHGLQLGQAQVGQQHAGNGGQGHGAAFAQAAGGDADAAEAAPQLATVRAPDALVDDFA